MKEVKPISGFRARTGDAAHIRVPSDVIERGAHIKLPDLPAPQAPAPATAPTNAGTSSGGQDSKGQ